MTILNCKIASIETIIDTVYRVRLLAENKFYFRAGQYLKIIINELDKRPFSLATIPSKDRSIELHIGSSEFNFYTMETIKYILSHNNINIDLPYGRAWFRENSKKPIILIAGGTGFSYTRAILYAALKENPARDITFYWGGKNLEQLYDLTKLQILSKKFPNIKIIPVIEKPEVDWLGKTGTVLSVILNDFCSLSKYEIYIAGRFEMAKIARERLCEKGISPEFLYGDAFEFI
ncbi:NAD(P)H-flavin reductase [Candidatus Arsenophonus lipoptenae]|uniref:NAD(P)H-flavin reductase n=1 Tax=Candidatus Arsenophonus lipoptenae TaxID=634113 RepID=A0A109QE76_9GAMM|nr:NAD(P)H-flavin reductase [Candidatus Arsenophonus lipoptenae]AMA65070.1 NAD(P)H-flavin reductase [Candidatus Arsenophonus lipoptenae]